jgi:hypothetical protein
MMTNLTWSNFVKSKLSDFCRRTAPMLALVFAVLIGSAGPAAAGPDDEDGAPVLVVSQYVTSPSPVRTGESFTLTITVTNTGSKYANNIMASVGSSGQFVGIGAPASLGQLDPNMSATVSLEVRAGSIAAGAYPLQVELSFRIGESGEQITARSVGIQVTGGTGVAGDPQVVIHSAKILTQPQAAGDRFDVQLVLRNAGERKAYGVSAALSQNEYISPAQGGGTSAVGDLAPGQSLTFTASLVLAKISPTGRADLSYELDYRDSGNTDHSSTETASLELGAAARQNPQLIVAGYRTEPEHPGPGDRFTLWLQVTNVGAGPARRVLARLGGDDGLDPFLPLATSNVGYAGEIAPGATAAFSTTLLMSGSAAGGAYSLTVDLGYENTLAEPLTETEIVGLLTLARPQLQIDLTKPLPATVSEGDAFDLAIEVVNIGRQRVEISTIEVLSDDLHLTKNSLYIGPLDSSISGALTAKATARTAGPAEYRVIVHYRDEMNQWQTVEQTFRVEVADAGGQAPNSPPASSDATNAPATWWQVLLRLVGLGG